MSRTPTAISGAVVVAEEAAAQPTQPLATARQTPAAVVGEREAGRAAKAVRPSTSAEAPSKRPTAALVRLAILAPQVQQVPARTPAEVSSAWLASGEPMAFRARPELRLRLRLRVIRAYFPQEPPLVRRSSCKGHHHRQSAAASWGSSR